MLDNQYYHNLQVVITEHQPDFELYPELENQLLVITLKTEPCEITEDIVKRNQQAFVNVCVDYYQKHSQLYK